MDIINIIEKMDFSPQKIDVHVLVDTITLMLNTYDKYTAGHSYRVAYWAEKLSRCFVRSEEEHHRVHIAAHLHDIGKIGVSHEILNKKGRLTAQEYGLVQQHSEKGYDILQKVEPLQAIATIVLYHHERYDGVGYPHGLRGKDIPFDSRIISVVDAFDAMTTSRPYRDKLSYKEARMEIVAGAGGQFDPVIVDKFLAMDLWYGEQHMSMSRM